MATDNSSSGDTPETKPDESEETFQDYLNKLRESGLEVIDTTQSGATTVFVGGVHKKPRQ